ncbi:bifunctional DedA family/phosphatase PAP2 family protein [Cohnella silvisoli]|uniref:Bifunctional DedA family/phosphatase PAP2 family protein n=1 Tax=Cohnella silvisoli TaxID=2873699 RepID=A0ABV1L1V9_9BACL|nr:bifunctional DedA family/phosphatase PAP2 family protein [Cohnella silvisoli]MCD9025246.1 bifunctional DedA family/phosphatase PAP2 family protein [Cohnella silvisoli]
MGFFTNLLEQYGYWVLFLALMLELIALPLPGEFIMTYAGLIVFEGNLNWFLCIVVAGSGACLGMTISYCIGYRLGYPFFEKYGSRVHFGPERLNSVSRWFQRYGNKMLLIAYFIPGVRHLTGIFSGTTRLSYRKYAVYAYSGAFIWVTLFISFGKLLGPEWERYHHTINRYMIILGILSAIIYLCIYLFRKYKARIQIQMLSTLEKAFLRYRSMGRVKFIVITAFAGFILFFSLMLGLIQDFLAHEFAQFDEVTFYIVHEIFDPNWSGPMNRFAFLGTDYVFVPLIIFTCVWIWFKGKDRLLELTFMAIVNVGGEALNEGLHLLFHRAGPTGILAEFTFPSEQTLLSLTVCGFAAYLLVRHYGNLKTRVLATSLVIILCLLVGISRIFFNVQYASDVAAGYVFGGVWLTLNVILLEIFRVARLFLRGHLSFPKC